MESSRPKFCLTELVRVKGQDREVADMHFMTGQRFWVEWGKLVIYTGWAYRVKVDDETGRTEEGWLLENQIAKTRQPDTLGWFFKLMSKGTA